MAVYKGYEVDDNLYSVIRSMPKLQEHRDDLQRQQVSWDYLSVMAQLANLENELSSARKQFNRLTGVLLNSLGLETLKKSTDEYGAMAQDTINILVRNLFERTADIGFLATDQDIRQYLQNGRLGDDQKSQTAQLQARFQSYVDKYSVYHDVVLLDTEGRVLVRLEDHHDVAMTLDPYLEQALTTDAEYVTHFGQSDLFKKDDDSLIFAYRVLSEETQEPIGIVCLCFKFEDEMEGIFGHLIEATSKENLLLLDAEHRIISTSNKDLLPLGGHIKFDDHKLFDVVYSNGREYFCCARQPESYQGYKGAGWLGCAMVPIDQIFTDEAQVQNYKQAILDSVMGGNLFDDETKSIPTFANQIQKELNRSVWNGNVLQASEKNGPDAAVSKVLLSEIKNTGLSTKKIFEDSVLEIQKTAISSVLKSSQAKAALAIDIMDRNLYERANDCRWWSVNGTIQAMLNKDHLTEDDQKQLQTVLTSINDLYTVYTNIIVFNKQGKVIGVSNANYQHLVGTVQQATWARSVSTHTNSQQYSVSEFTPTDLYDGKPSYIYSSAVQDDNNAVIGGVAIVFDSEPQFKAILDDVLPKVDEGGSVAIFTDQQKKIIASTHAEYKVGNTLSIDDAFYGLEKGQATSKTLEINNHYYSVGAAKSTGYREYKGATDAYQEEVYAFVMIDIGEMKSVSEINRYKHPETANLLSTNQFKTQIASFYVEDIWLGFRSEKVLSAVHVDNIVPIHGQESTVVAGYMVYKGQSISLLHTAMLMGANKPNTQEINEAVVIKVGDNMIALSIDGLGEMLDIDPMSIQAVGGEVAVTSKVVKEVVLSNAESPNDSMLQLMDIDLIEKELQSVVVIDDALAVV